MIRHVDLPLIGLHPTPRPDTRTRKFVVDHFDGAWRVTCPGGGEALLPDREEAIGYAVVRARDTAAHGAVGMVVVKSGLHELHCFTPDAGEA